MSALICDSDKCGKVAAARYFWPGRPPGYYCATCLLRALNVASAMGFYLHHEALEPDELAKQEGQQ